MCGVCRGGSLLVILRVKGGVFGIEVLIQVGGEFLHALLGGERGEHHVHGVAGQARGLVHLRHGLHVRDDFVEDVVAKLLVGVLTTAETELEADLVAMVQEAFRTGHFHIIVIGIRTDAELDFLKFDGSALVVFLELGLLVFVLAVINHAAYGRIGIAGHFHQVQTQSLGFFQRVARVHDAQLVAVGSHYPHAERANPFIDPSLIAAVTAAISVIILRWLGWHVRILLN